MRSHCITAPSTRVYIPSGHQYLYLIYGRRSITISDNPLVLTKNLVNYHSMEFSVDRTIADKLLSTFNFNKSIPADEVVETCKRDIASWLMDCDMNPYEVYPIVLNAAKEYVGRDESRIKALNRFMEAK